MVRLLDGAFTALLLISGVSAVIVPPPTNVTVSCQNLKTTVRWDYSEPQPQTSFRVHIRGSAGNYERETIDHQYDLSPFVQHYMDFLYVTVTAVQGGNQSEGVSSNTFSYNYLKTVDTTCVLDFPPVDVIVDESRATVSFQNPFKYYKELKKAIKADAASLKFTISPVAMDSRHVGDFEGFCTAKETTCKLDVKFHEGVERCVTLKGFLLDRMGVHQVVFKETAHVCAPESAGVHVVMFAVILLSSLVLIIIVLVITICKVKAWTMKIPSLPSSLVPNHRERDLRYDTVPRRGGEVAVPISAVSVSEDENHSKNIQDSIADEDCSPPAGSLHMERHLSESSDQELEAEQLISEGNRTDDDSADDSVKTECISIDSEEEEKESVSPYDCPHVLTLDMGDGDMVTGYTGS